MSNSTTYRITNTNGLTTGRWALTYLSRDNAAEELRLARGWDEVHLSAPFAEVDSEGREVGRCWCAYETEAERDADDTGAFADRIVEIDG